MSADALIPSEDPVVPVPDDRDWTVVLEAACDECGFDAATLDRHDLPARTRDAAARFVAALARPDVAVRPAPAVWSTLEYACHVGDVLDLFDRRLALMREQDDPVFANWDQDETALAQRYWEQDPGAVADRLREAADTIATSFASVREDEWSRPGRRSNGSQFTIDSFGRYFLHDLVHHLHDIRA